MIGAAGAAEKRVRVVEGRRRKEARSLEAIVVVCGSWVVCFRCEGVGGGARMRCAEVVVVAELEVRVAHFKMVQAAGGCVLG